MATFPYTQRTVLSRKLSEEYSVGVRILQSFLKYYNFTDYNNATIVSDGFFGPKTEEALKKFQKTNYITTDGIAGYITQGIICRKACERISIETGVPIKILNNLCEHESNKLLQIFNKDVPGGVDVGPFQIRIYESDYNDLDYIRKMTDPVISGRKAADALKKKKIELYPIITSSSKASELFDDYGLSTNDDKRSWQLAILNHNYPVAAYNLARGKTNWTFIDYDGVRKDCYAQALWCQQLSGGVIKTVVDWCNFYVKGIYP